MKTLSAAVFKLLHDNVVAMSEQSVPCKSRTCRESRKISRGTFFIGLTGVFLVIVGVINLSLIDVIGLPATYMFIVIGIGMAIYAVVVYAVAEATFRYPPESSLE